jgi:aminoglycoside phosphotransferase (APT) family kinase protein
MRSGVEAPVIDAALVRRLVAAQFPQWAGLSVRPVAEDGWDNRTFRLGDELSIRLPSAARYAAAVAKEQAWLPRLAPDLPRPIPEPVAQGAPSRDYPWPWSVCRWLPGETAAATPPSDMALFAVELAEFLLALQAIEGAGGPPPGQANFHRGGSLAVYDGQTREALERLSGHMDLEPASSLWEAALTSPYTGPPVWLHGDIAPSNLLVRDGRLSGVIDFGQCAVGDPACDLGIAWTFLDDPARGAFRARLSPDDGLWTRARGWTLWKALIVVAGLPGTNQRQRPLWQAALAAVLEDR